MHGNNEDFDSKQTPVLFFQTRARAQNRMSMNLVVAPRSSEKSDDQLFWSGHWALERRQPPELRPQLVILCRDLFAGSFKSPSNILSLAPSFFDQLSSMAAMARCKANEFVLTSRLSFSQATLDGGEKELSQESRVWLHRFPCDFTGRNSG